MTKLKVLRAVIGIENFMCIYRNYSVISLQKKLLVQVYIFVVISAHLLAYINLLVKTFLTFLQLGVTFTLFVLSYSVFSIINNMAAIILSCYHSEIFQAFIKNVNVIYIICENDALYQEAIKKLNKQFIKTAVICFGIIISMLILFFINYVGYFHDLNILIHIMSDLTLQFRYFWENLTFHLLIEVLVANIDYLNNSISAATNNLDNKGIESLEQIEDVKKMSKALKKWGEVSGLLVNAIDCLGCTFGLQITLSLWSSVLYQVMLLYQAILFALNKGSVYIARVGAAGFVTTLTAYFLTKLSMLWSGQRARNQARRFDAALARLHVKLQLIPGNEAEACAQATLRLARRLRAAPMRLRLLSSPTVQMALLAEILGVVANYTIVLLQFNHVV